MSREEAFDRLLENEDAMYNVYCKLGSIQEVASLACVSKATMQALQKAEAEIILAVCGDAAPLLVLGRCELPPIPDFIKIYWSRPVMYVLQQQQDRFIRVLDVMMTRQYVAEEHVQTWPEAAERVAQHALSQSELDWAYAMAPLGAWSMLADKTISASRARLLLQYARDLPQAHRPSIKQVADAAVSHVLASQLCDICLPCKDVHLEVLNELLGYCDNHEGRQLCHMRALLSAACKAFELRVLDDDDDDVEAWYIKVVRLLVHPTPQDGGTRAARAATRLAIAAASGDDPQGDGDDCEVLLQAAIDSGCPDMVAIALRVVYRAAVGSPAIQAGFFTCLTVDTAERILCRVSLADVRYTFAVVAKTLNPPQLVELLARLARTSGQNKPLAARQLHARVLTRDATEADLFVCFLRKCSRSDDDYDFQDEDVFEDDDYPGCAEVLSLAFRGVPDGSMKSSMADAVVRTIGHSVRQQIELQAPREPPLDTPEQRLMQEALPFVSAPCVSALLRCSCLNFRQLVTWLSATVHDERLLVDLDWTVAGELLALDLPDSIGTLVACHNASANVAQLVVNVIHRCASWVCDSMLPSEADQDPRATALRLALQHGMVKDAALVGRLSCLGIL
jgi:hypothetical protein